jgi:LPXTG-motif cell wall-anchored protein
MSLRIQKKRIFALVAAVSMTVFSGGSANAAYESLSGYVEVSYTTSPTISNPSPALEVKATGVFISSTTRNSYRIQVRPKSTAGYTSTWSTSGWVAKSGCPTNVTAGTSTLSACGVAAVYIDDVLVDPSLLSVSSQSETSGTDFGGANSNVIPGTVLIALTSPNTFTNSLSLAGDVRVQMAAGAWDLSGSATLSPHWEIVMNTSNGTAGIAIMGVKTVTFDPNTGDGSKYSQTRNLNWSAALASNQFSKSNSSFAGWNTEANGSGTSYAAGATYPFAVSDILYAQWTANAPAPAETTAPAATTPPAAATPAAPTAPAAKLATTGVSAEWLLVAGLLSAIAGSGFLAFSRRKRIW